MLRKERQPVPGHLVRGGKQLAPDRSDCRRLRARGSEYLERCHTYIPDLLECAEDGRPFDVAPAQGSPVALVQVQMPQFRTVANDGRGNPTLLDIHMVCI